MDYSLNKINKISKYISKKSFTIEKKMEFTDDRKLLQHLR